jgi:DNA-binding MarR family transcriptional regulator
MIGALLNLPSFALAARVNAALDRRGFADVTLSHTTVMKVLGPEGNRITELANRAVITKQSMGYLVEQLEAAGYVERAPDPSDGRATIIGRTPKGWAYNKAAAEEVAAVQREWTRLLGEAKMQQLRHLLSELTTKLGYKFEGSVPDIATRTPARAVGSATSSRRRELT